MRLLGAVGALEKDGRVWPELIDHLAARSAGRAGDAVIVGNGHGLNLNLGAELRNRSENCGPLGAVGHAVGRVLYIATGEHFAIRQQDRRTHVKVRIRSMRVLHHLSRGLLQFFPYIDGDCFLWHENKTQAQCGYLRRIRVIVNPALGSPGLFLGGLRG